MIDKKYAVNFGGALGGNQNLKGGETVEKKARYSDKVIYEAIRRYILIILMAWGLSCFLIGLGIGMLHFW